MVSKFFGSVALVLAITVSGLSFGATKQAQAATIGTFNGNDVVREIRVVRLNGQRIHSVSPLEFETGGSDGVTVEYAQFRNQLVVDFGIDTGEVAAGETAYGWFRFSGSLTFKNDTASTQSATILTDMLGQGSIQNPDTSKVNVLEGVVSLTQDGTSVFSATMGGEGVTTLNTRVGTGAALGGITTLTFAPGSTSEVGYSFFAQVVVNGPIPAAVPVPASGLILLGALGAFAVARRRQSTRRL